MPQDQFAKPSNQNSRTALQDIFFTSKTNVKRWKLSNNYSQFGLFNFEKNHSHKKHAICGEMPMNG